METISLEVKIKIFSFLVVFENLNIRILIEKIHTITLFCSNQSTIFLQIIFILNPEKISGGRITIPAYDDIINYIPGLILPSDPSEIFDIESVSITSITILFTYFNLYRFVLAHTFKYNVVQNTAQHGENTLRCDAYLFLLIQLYQPKKISVGASRRIPCQWKKISVGASSVFCQLSFVPRHVPRPVLEVVLMKI